MKTLRTVASRLALTSPLKKFASIALIGAATSAHADIVVGESFSNYSSLADLNGQAVTGTGLTGNWTASPYYRTQDLGLTMNGVYSEGGSLYFPTSSATQNFLRIASAPIAESLSDSVSYFGSYLFTFFSNGTVPKTVGALGLGNGTETDNNASFVWAGNGYNTQASPVVEGPAIRAEGSAWQVPGLALTIGTTYVMLFEFNASLGTTSAWVLNEAQLANFSGSLNAATLNAAVMNTEDPTGIAFGATVTASKAVDPMTNLMMFGSISTDPSFLYIWDEIRISNTSLTEAVTNVSVPEPSTIAALGLGLGVFAIRHTLRRRRAS